MNPRLLRAKDPIDLLNQVMFANTQGEDMHAQLFLSDGKLCQWVVKTPVLYEYRLIEAADLDEYELHVQNLKLLDYDLFFNPVHWNGKLVQWMHRWNERGTQVREAVTSVLIPAPREEELKLVADVQAELEVDALARRLGEKFLRIHCQPIPQLLCMDGIVIP